MTQEQFQLATQHHQKGQFEAAEQLYLGLLQQQGEHPVLLSRLANICAQTKRPDEALNYFDKAITMAPSEPQLLQPAIELALARAEHALAKRWLELSLQINPADDEARERLAGVLMASGEENLALQALTPLLAKSPNHASLLNLKGLALCRLGETDKGYKFFQRAVKAAPGQLAAIKNLVAYGKGKKEPLLEQLIPQLEKQFQQAGAPEQLRASLSPILFAYYEKSKPDKAFHFLKTGNDLLRASYRYEHAQTKSLFERILMGFDQGFLNELRALAAEAPSPKIRPIFILGMPRSGTSLVEQILASHSLVEPEGEIDFLRKAFEQEAGCLLDHQASKADRLQSALRVASSYIENVVSHQDSQGREGAQFFTDKMPYNFIMTGLIAAAMPFATIIHCTREPLETSFSIYKQNFSGAHAYTNDLIELGQYFNAYKSMMHAWEDRVPDAIYEANYERMIDGSDQEIRALLSACGLEEEEACFAFYKNKRAVRTASETQVRQPIYRHAMKASNAYDEFLAPLKQVLASGEGALDL